MSLLRALFLGSLLGAGAAASLAGTAGASFSIQLTLHTGAGGGLPVTPPVEDPAGPGPLLPVTPPGPVIPPPGGGTPFPIPGPGAGGGTPVVPAPGQDPGPSPGTGVAGGGASNGGETVPPAPVPLTLQPPAPPAPVVLASRGGFCTSQSLSERSNAIVRVLCSTGQFVSIEPAPGRPFAGTHGGAWRFSFGPGTPTGLAGAAGPHIGAGTVTAFRILNVGGQTSPLEMLVSF